MSFNEERFAVSTQGMAELHRDREPVMLIKELVQNVWDESVNGATNCVVTVESVPDRRNATLVTVEDDGPGFSNITDAYTLMRPTEKRLDPKRRGRFNLGDKEVAAVSISAEIETVGHTVIFPEEGGRQIVENDRTRGTIVRAIMPWSKAQAEDLDLALRRFRPTDCGLEVNGHTVPKREPLATRRARLTTVVQDAPGEPMRQSRRMTDIDVLEPHEDGTGWLYELGIPIQEIDTVYDIDIGQKVPMPPNRDTVAQNYLQDVLSEVLNATHEILEGPQFADAWIRTAVEDPRITSEAVHSVVEGRYGPKVALWSSNTNANLEAAEEGFEVLHPRSMSPEEREHLRDRGGLKSTSVLFKQAKSFKLLSPIELDEIHDRFGEWVQKVAALAGMDATVAFTRDPKTNTAACCTCDTMTPRVLFNLAHLDEDFLRGRGQPQLALLVHELGHAENAKAMEHGPRWGNACAAVGARIALAMAAMEEAPA